MILIGIDDTDNAESPGTNQLAKAIAKEVARDWKCERIVRHQLLQDVQIPCTTRNGAASILLSPRFGLDEIESQMLSLVHQCRELMKRSFAPGSDPGICVTSTENVTECVRQFGFRCQFEIVSMNEAIQVADKCSIHLEGLGGTNGGMIGALAAVGLAATGNDGRVVQIGEWIDDLTGTQPIENILSRGVLVRNIDDDEPISDGTVTLDKKLRPSLRDNRIVLFVQKHRVGEASSGYQAIRFQ
ncbi:hypothetical protein KOR42_14810 [Thalassoglobus neptunius]|uniref:Uncharacterized protein n=1 Tax=Thalassoglobus neptunius TaxID=1938619 RepID=A0A5C5X5A6_9PLAN|nr:ABC transporter substrate-binding protein [Thalassoglobus neptunius]TWT58110.1 hypothetical protein KOR42_14810 [Thalassoglobus neptunius]